MGFLTLVRHGQASFLADDYDRLSPLGERQARLLGEHWARTGVSFDRFVSGPALRQRATGEAVVAAFREAGRELPPLEMMPEFDEFAWLQVFQVFVPILCERDPHMVELVEAFRKVQGTPEAMAPFDALLRAVMPHWLEGTIQHADVESWVAFRDRVRRGIDRVLSNGSRNVAVFTSAGTMAAVTADALDLTPINTIKLTMVTRNAAWSEFLFGADRFSLNAFNCTPHLPPDLVTLR